jgi:hypothetical protein
MYGILIDCFEKFIIITYGEAVWSLVLHDAEITEILRNDGWNISENYSDGVMSRLASAICSITEGNSDDIFEKFGYFFLNYARSVSSFNFHYIRSVS